MMQLKLRSSFNDRRDGRLGAAHEWNQLTEGQAGRINYMLAVMGEVQAEAA